MNHAETYHKSVEGLCDIFSFSDENKNIWYEKPISRFGIVYDFAYSESEEECHWLSTYDSEADALDDAEDIETISEGYRSIFLVDLLDGTVRPCEIKVMALVGGAVEQ